MDEDFSILGFSGMQVYFYFIKLSNEIPVNKRCVHDQMILRRGLSELSSRVKLCIFGQTPKFGQRPCLYHISNIGIKKIY